MNGVVAIRQLLVGNAALVAAVPSSRIRAGVLPLATDLPALGIRSVSSIDRNIIAPGSTRRVTDRVQVTILAADYPELKEVTRLVKDAGADTFPTVDGISDVVVHTDGQGPDFMDENATIYAGTQDFRISYNEER